MVLINIVILKNARMSVRDNRRIKNLRKNLGNLVDKIIQILLIFGKLECSPMAWATWV